MKLYRCTVIQCVMVAAEDDFEPTKDNLRRFLRGELSEGTSVPFRLEVSTGGYTPLDWLDRWPYMINGKDGAVFAPQTCREILTDLATKN